jgi:pimeloyl-[acyl-carrier protein] methyl ester esterase
MIYTIHGWSFGKELWKGTPFEEACHLELPGHVESPFKSTELKELSLEIGKSLTPNSHLVGWSLGATVAALVAVSFKEKVGKLTLIAPTPSFTGTSQPEAVVKRFLKKLKRDFKGGVEYFRSLCSKRRAPTPKLNEAKATELLASFSSFSGWELFKQIEAPTEILVGEEDQITKLSGAFQTFKLIKDSSLRVLPGEDHLTVLFHAI